MVLKEQSIVEFNIKRSATDF